LKTFLTQFGPILPLTSSDPPVKLHDDQKGGTTIKITIWGAFLPKTNYFCHPTLFYPPHVPAGPALLPDFLRSLPARLAPRLHTNSPPHWGARPWGGAGERAVRASARGGARPRGDVDLPHQPRRSLLCALPLFLRRHDTRASPSA
jgi:hypothetical protein